MKTVTLSSEYKINIPKYIRDQLHFKPGQQFILIPKGKSLHIVPIRNLQQVKGILKNANTNDIRDYSDIN